MVFSFAMIISYVFFQCLLCAAKAKTHSFSLTVDRINGAPDGYYIPDGLFAVNGWSPAPPIYVDTGDRIIATVTNNLTTGEGTLVHWHGILQKGSNRMDGVPFVTQYLVMPGENFTYDFYVDVPGTYWYHSHYAEQYIEGLRGALIVRYPPDLPIYSDVALILSDWYHGNKTYELEKYLVPSAEGVEPVPITALINGVGQNESCILELNCKYVSVLANQFAAECGAYSKYAELLAAQNASATAGGDAKVTRLRLVDGSAFAVLNISIDNHFFWVTALDGNPVEPQKADYFIMNTGQRVDLVVCRSPSSSPTVTTTTSAWIRARMVEDAFGYDSANAGVLGILNYENLASSNFAYLPTSGSLLASEGYDQIFDHSIVQANPGSILPATGANYNEFTLSAVNESYFYEFDTFNQHPFKPSVSYYETEEPTMYPPPNATKTINIRIDFYENDAGVNVAHFNHISMGMMHDPTSFVPLIDRLNSSSESLIDNGETGGMHLIEFDTSDVVELIIDNYDGGEHPIHIHGRRLYVIARGNRLDGPYNATVRERNEVNPVLRDTITVLEGSYIVLRFADKNPGLWMMHCHIDWHMAAGLAMVLHERVTTTSTSQSADSTAALSSAAIGGIIAGGLVFGLGFTASIFFYYTLVHKPKKDDKRQKQEHQAMGCIPVNNHDDDDVEKGGCGCDPMEAPYASPPACASVPVIDEDFIPPASSSDKQGRSLSIDVDSPHGVGYAAVDGADDTTSTTQPSSLPVSTSRGTPSSTPTTPTSSLTAASTTTMATPKQGTGFFTGGSGVATNISHYGEVASASEESASLVRDSDQDQGQDVPIDGRTSHEHEQERGTQ